MSLLGILLVVFVVLKLAGLIAWSWLWVLSPLWIGFAIWLVMAFMIVSVKRSMQWPHSKR